ncbi:MAG TPA: 16S rRNA (uracil(1498)-N(3))-methyltransferase [Vicinamibacterales bacterium]|nr:16S rRNA (uracil(1498)-N(3))-methyltransferase [Vicinamibacterales bacterium]
METNKPAARVYAPAARAYQPLVELSAEEAHHLKHVLRLRAGDEVAVFDGAGHEWAARLSTTGRSMGAELGRPLTPVPEPPVRVILAIGLLKGDQMDAVVRDATMLGVAEIVPMSTAHVAVAGRAREGDKARLRWGRVAVASAKQCGRAVVPVVTSIASFQTVVGEVARDWTVIATEPVAETPALPAVQTRPKTALVLVGPEGGWSRAEVDLAVQHGARRMQLGPRTLRAESAPIVLLSALWAEWGWT